MFGLRSAVSERMGRRAHLSPVQIDGSLAERRSPFRARHQEIAQQIMMVSTPGSPRLIVLQLPRVE